MAGKGKIAVNMPVMSGHGDYPGSGELEGVAHRLREPVGNAPHPALIMVHGFQGDENSTWIFARAASPEWLVASPRAPLAASSGFSWYHCDEKGKSDPVSLKQGAEALADYIESIAAHYPIDRDRLVVLGFSQGAAMAYTYGLTHPVRGIISLGGFIPGPMLHPLPRIPKTPILIIHGTLDSTIPVDIARKNRDQLTEAGADVTYFEEAIGHKVGAKGMRLLEQWIAQRR